MDDRSPHDDDRGHSAAAERAARAVRALDVEAPPRLRASVEAAAEAASGGAGRRRRRGPRIGVAFAAATAVVAIAVVLALGLSRSGDEGGTPGAAPTVPEAARVALQEPTAQAPAQRPGGRLDASIAGIDFPDWSPSWTAAGERTDELGGRALRTVVYDDADGQRFGYAIADGDPLPWGGGEVYERDGVELWVYEVDDATVVAWLRDGHTCILAGRDVDRERLMDLASSRNA